MSSTEEVFTELFDLLVKHQRAHRRGHYYYCWKSQEKYNWLKRHDLEHIYHAAMHQARDQLDQEEDVAQKRKAA
ncbi:MAG: hypothetical protein Q8L20_10940 [Gammaproteobacteria bacterium]|nr:hypothetical protein [Gammaproteobacteria bacterium]